MKKTINVTRSSMPSYEEYCEEIKELWDSRWLTNMGAKHQQLQSELEKKLSVPHVTLYTNGHLALEAVLQAMNLPAGGEVITTPFTFASTTHAIVRSGLTPVFCDVNDIDYTMDVTKIEKLITPKTVAIVPVHVYGNICDVDAIQQIAEAHGLKVVYDAAHAFGAFYRDQSAACFGDASMFSFHATKVFNTIEGGAVCYHDDTLVKKLDDQKNFGMSNAEYIPYVGYNAKMNEFQAAMGICNLRHLDAEIAKRKAVVAQYRSHLSGIKGIRLCPEQPEVISNYAYFPVVFEEAFGADRDAVCAALGAEGVGARKYFYPLTNTFDCFHGAYDVNQTPVALQISERVLTLPLYADLSMEDVDRICDVILRCQK